MLSGAGARRARTGSDGKVGGTMDARDAVSGGKTDGAVLTLGAREGRGVGSGVARIGLETDNFGPAAGEFMLTVRCKVEGRVVVTGAATAPEMND